MAIRKTLIRTEAGVRLERIEALSGRQKVVSTLYCLRTLRPNQPRMIADRDEAEAAFAREVTASLKDPVIRALVAAGD